MKTQIISIGLFFATGAAWAQTTSIAIPDFSFEGISKSITSSSNTTNSSTFGAWNAAVNGSTATITVGSGSATMTVGTPSSLGSSVAAPDGASVLQLSLSESSGVLSSGASRISLKQTLSTSFLANSIYTLSFYCMNANASSISLLSGTNKIQSLVISASSSSAYSLISLSYTNSSPYTIVTGSIGIALDAYYQSTLGAASASDIFYMDDFTLTKSPISVTPTPEPSTLALMSIGGISAFLIARRQTPFAPQNAGQ